MKAAGLYRWSLWSRIEVVSFIHLDKWKFSWESIKGKREDTRTHHNYFDMFEYGSSNIQAHTHSPLHTYTTSTHTHTHTHTHLHLHTHHDYDIDGNIAITDDIDWSERRWLNKLFLSLQYVQPTSTSIGLSIWTPRRSLIYKIYSLPRILRVRESIQHFNSRQFTTHYIHASVPLLARITIYLAL